MELYKILCEVNDDKGLCELCKGNLEVKNYYKNGQFCAIFFRCSQCGSTEMLLLERMKPVTD